MVSPFSTQAVLIAYFEKITDKTTPYARALALAYFDSVNRVLR